MDYTDRMAYKLLKIPELYKFRPFSSAIDIERTRKIIEESRIYFPKPTEVNDPWDCKLRFHVPTADDKEGLARCIDWLIDVDRRLGPEKSEQQRKSEEARLRADIPFTLNTLRELTPELQRDVYAKYRILSLASVIDHPLLWSHYADAHHGICLVFSTDHTEFGYAEQITYQPELPVQLIDSNDGRELVLATFLTKAKYWEYEAEFRIATCTSADAVGEMTKLTPEGELVFPEAKLLRVVYGCRMSNESKQRIEVMLAKRKSPVGRVQARLDDDCYRLRFEALD